MPYTLRVKGASVAAVFLAGAGLFVLACAGILGIEDISVDAGGDGGVPDLAPDAAPSLNCPLGCLPPPPAGWTGPSAVFEGPLQSKPAGCPATYTVKEVEGHQGLRAPPPTCACGPAVVAGASCRVGLERFDGDDCVTGGSGAVDVVVPSNPCAAISGTLSFYVSNVTLIAKGTCTYPNPVREIPPITFEKLDVACGLPQSGSCATRPDCTAAPVPDAPFTRVCLHSPGDVSCPSVDYAVRFVTRESFEDKRACDLSGCGGTPVGDTCAKKLAVVGAATCGDGGTTVFPLNADECQPSTNTTVDLRGIKPISTCPPATAMPVGAATSTGATTTFCCNR
jgi:hypothetical protein